MKHLILVLLLLTACTLSKSTLESGPLYKVGDSFKTNSGFYLGEGKISVTAVLYGACSSPGHSMEWVYYGTLTGNNNIAIQDVEVCENELRDM
jgi:hypothetical protein